MGVGGWGDNGSSAPGGSCNGTRPQHLGGIGDSSDLGSDSDAAPDHDDTLSWPSQPYLASQILGQCLQLDGVFAWAASPKDVSTVWAQVGRKEA